VFGRLSNYVGRRPIAIIALAGTAIACLILTGMHDVLSLVAARVMQGVACGLASSGVGAYVVDTAPERPSWLPAAITAGAPMVGIPIGALACGALVEYGPAPRVLAYALMATVLAMCALLTAMSPETMPRRAGALAALRPRLTLPAGSRRLFLAAAAACVATWSIGGFYQAFGPSVTADYLGSGNALVSAGVFSAVMVLNPLGGPMFGRLRPAIGLRLGMTFFMVALLGIVASLHAHALFPFIVSSLLVGFAQGTASTGTMKALLSGAGAEHRAGLLSMIYLVSYCGVAFPTFLAGRLAGSVDLLRIGEGYAALGILFSIVAMLAMRDVPAN
jgi:MFS family permease